MPPLIGPQVSEMDTKAVYENIPEERLGSYRKVLSKHSRLATSEHGFGGPSETYYQIHEENLLVIR